MILIKHLVNIFHLSAFFLIFPSHAHVPFFSNQTSFGELHPLLLSPLGDRKLRGHDIDWTI